ncbi:hypothetical protein FCM35_KLT00586 [Carex littledalei]|uniref:Uncharacterized protein n=1 Tax=Carex littledalei TaxID=544730 RepID=A0A833RWP8_9POAL|nr:hypothetical protein FCM35_KLT00586 [Carex littledalei]
MEHDNEGACITDRITIDMLKWNVRVEGTLEKKVAPEKKKVAPEKKLKTFAIKMFIPDVMAIVLGMLKSCLVVQKTDMGATVKSITVLTLILDVFRILCRSRGLELNFMYNMKQLPLSIRIISRIFYCLHLISVLTVGVVSAVELASHDFGKTEEALVFFYAVAILEAMVFLAAMAIWIRYRRLFEEVRDECGLDKSDMDSLNRFFYNFYCKCVTGSILDARKMDLVIFAQELLYSILDEEQLMGASILKALSTHPDLSGATLDKIITSEDSKLIDRLIKILTWENSFKEEVRCSAAVIVSKLDKREPKMVQSVKQMKEAMESAKDLLRRCSEDVERDAGSRAL